MSLDRQREVDLSISAKVDPANQFVDFRVVEIMAEDYEGVLDVPRRGEADNQVFEVLCPGVDLNDHDYRRVVHRAERGFVVDHL